MLALASSWFQSTSGFDYYSELIYLSMIPTALNQHDESNTVMNIILLLKKNPHRYRVEQMSWIYLVHRLDLTGSQVKSN